MSPWVWDSSGVRLSVQFKKSARSPWKSVGAASPSDAEPGSDMAPRDTAGRGQRRTPPLQEAVHPKSRRAGNPPGPPAPPESGRTHGSCGAVQLRSTSAGRHLSAEHEQADHVEHAVVVAERTRRHRLVEEHLEEDVVLRRLAGPRRQGDEGAV